MELAGEEEAELTALGGHCVACLSAKQPSLRSTNGRTVLLMISLLV